MKGLMKMFSNGLAVLKEWRVKKISLDVGQARKIVHDRSKWWKVER